MHIHTFESAWLGCYHRETGWRQLLSGGWEGVCAHTCTRDHTQVVWPHQKYECLAIHQSFQQSYMMVSMAAQFKTSWQSSIHSQCRSCRSVPRHSAHGAGRRAVVWGKHGCHPQYHIRQTRIILLPLRPPYIQPSHSRLHRYVRSNR